MFFVVIIAVLAAYYLYAKWKQSYWRRNGVPQLNSHFIYGDLQLSMTNVKNNAELFYDFYQHFRRMGVRYGGVYAFTGAIFTPVDPEIIKLILLKDFDHFTAHFPNFSKKTIFVKGLFHLEGEDWRNTRKKLTPTFTSGKMKMMFELMAAKTAGLEDLVGKIADSDSVLKVKETLERFTTDVIGSCGFGLECNSMKDPDSEFLKYGRRIFESPAKPPSLLMRMFLRPGQAQKKHVETEEFFKNVVVDTMKYRSENKVTRKDFLQLMIQLKNQGAVSEDDSVPQQGHKLNQTESMTDEDVTAQCLLFFIAGFETSATTMTYALLELAQNEDIQEKVRQEVNEVLAKYDGVMTYEAMLDLKYTESVIMETMRKYPPVALLPRVCTKDYTIPDTKVTIKKGTAVLISTWGLHKDPEYFPNPEKFDPTRFSQENKKNIRDYTYMPFGEGPRMCLGLRFGMMQSKVGLATMIRTFKVTLNKNTYFPLRMKKPSFITTVEGDVWLNVEKCS
ncbi:cytochrome P450 6k1-like [Rhynchophorus ferrugineus]|uniref:cytochrome P450 6k1-like n=1 Tax=Rhynchophorus ferrugineus TaxID=354439 RepID=UPI003FCEC44A